MANYHVSLDKKVSLCYNEAIAFDECRASFKDERTHNTATK